MQYQKLENSTKEIRHITNLSIVINIVLAVSKIVIGYLAFSMALVADGLHSFSDLVTDFAVLVGVHYGAKRPDKTHTYGHGRIESLTAAIIAAVLLVVGGSMVYYASVDLAAGRIHRPGTITIIIAVISIIAKEFIFQVTKAIAIKTHSSALYANAWHHRSDALSSVFVLIGLVSMKFGFPFGDQIAAIIVGFMIAMVGLKLLGDFVKEISERSADSKTIQHIEQIIDSDSNILQYHKLRSRIVGREIFLDVHILVDPQLNITQAHEISENFENTLHHQISRPINIIVHVEPDIPQLRK